MTELSGMLEQVVVAAKLSPFASVGTAVLVLIATYYLIFKGRSENQSASSESTKSTSATSTTNNISSSNTKLKNVWDVSKNNASGADKKTYDDKPFGSSYYYAHNNSNTTGGYKDGLKLEDYVMNGPRLLSKGGQRVDDDQRRPQESDAEAAPKAKEPKSKSKITAHDPSVQNITKYLWDDPGDWNGIATIRIDTLPEKNSKTIDWKDVEIKNVQADLVGEGLLVKVETDRGKYQLKINKLYGDAAEIKTVVKSKRLLVRIYKKKNSVLVKRDKSNLEAWPQPHRKV